MHFYLHEFAFDNSNSFSRAMPRQAWLRMHNAPALKATR